MTMHDWNVVISVYQEGYRRVLRALRAFGPAEPSPYYNVLVMGVDQPLALLDAIENRTEESTALYDAISRVAPAMCCFEFDSTAALVEKAKPVLAEWMPKLAGRSFHVRLHRRGGAHDLSTQDAERRLDDFILEAAAQAGTPAKVSFTDPDAVIAIDTIDGRAGAALWTREDLARHRLLRPD